MPLSGMKIGVFWDWFNDCDLEVRTACREAVDALVKVGAMLIEVKVGVQRKKNMGVEQVCVVSSRSNVVSIKS